MCIKKEKKQHMERQVKNNIHHIYIYIYENKYNVCHKINGHKTCVQEDNVIKEKEKKST